MKKRGDHLSRAHFNGFVKDGQNWRQTLLFILFDILVQVCHWGASIFERLEFVFHVCSTNETQTERNESWVHAKNNTWRWNDVNRSELKYKLKKKVHDFKIGCQVLLLFRLWQQLWMKCGEFGEFYQIWFEWNNKRENTEHKLISI